MYSYLLFTGLLSLFTAVSLNKYVLQNDELINSYYMLYYQKKKSHIAAIQTLIQLLNKMIYVYITQCIFRNSKSIGNHLYEIQYCINYRYYRFRVPYKKGPRKYLQFIDDTDQDISYEMFEYVGPNDDFHRIPYKPEDFGLSSITVNYTDGNTKTFQKDEIIS